MSLEDHLYPLLRIYEAAPQPVKSLAGRAYRALPASLRYGSAYRRFQSEAQAVEDWDVEAVRAYQINELRQTLHAASKTPFYAGQFAACGVSPAKFESLEQLSDYPLLSKDQLIRHRDQMVTGDASQRLAMSTGGSSGVPVSFFLHKGISRPKEQAYLDATWARLGYRTEDRVAVIRGGVTSSRADGAISYHDAARDWLVVSTTSPRSACRNTSLP